MVRENRAQRLYPSAPPVVAWKCSVARGSGGEERRWAMSGTLEGKVVLVPGGGSGIGRASALALAREGSYLVNIVTPPRRTVCPSDRLPFDPEFGQPVN